MKNFRIRNNGTESVKVAGYPEIKPGEVSPPLTQEEAEYLSGVPDCELIKPEAEMRQLSKSEVKRLAVQRPAK